MVTDVISGKPARFLRNALSDTLAGDEPLPFPSQLRLTAPLAEAGNPQYMALYAGQSAALTVEMPAGALVQKLVDDASACFNSFI
jgi:nitronate monooxygenase